MTHAADMAASRADFRTERAVSVTYTRKATGTAITLDALPFGTDRSLTNEYQTALSAAESDFGVLVAELTESGTLYEPERGDLITIVRGSGLTEVFSVLPRDGDAYTWHDQLHTEYRVYTKRQSVTA